jgi:hypothetical protein
MSLCSSEVVEQQVLIAQLLSAHIRSGSTQFRAVTCVPFLQ